MADDQGVLKELQSFFKKYPDAQFSIRSLSNLFQIRDIHDYLIKLEERHFLIRSKKDINGKPVTHWQLNDLRGFTYNEDLHSTNSYQRRQHQAPTKYNIQENYYTAVNDYHQSSPLPPTKHEIFNVSSAAWIESDCAADNSSFCNDGKRTSDGNNDGHHGCGSAKESMSLENFSTRDLRTAPKRLVSSNTKFTNYLETSRAEQSQSSAGPNVLCTGVSNLNVNAHEFHPFNSPMVKDNKVKSNPFKRQNFDDQTTHVNGKELIRKDANKMSHHNREIENNNPKSDIISALEKNPVSVLHEYAQQIGGTVSIKMTEMDGPSHKPRMSMVVVMNGRQFDTVTATNKKDGKRKAADIAIRTLIAEGRFSKFSPVSSSIDAEKRPIPKSMKCTIMKKSTSSVSEYNKMVDIVYQKLAYLMNDLSEEDGMNLAGRKVISSIIMENKDDYVVVTLATGNRCITGDKISLRGKVVNDSHAEVVARRALMLFFYKQLNEQVFNTSKSLDIFEMSDEYSSFRHFGKFRIKPHVKFHLYISTAPCGDSALFCNKENMASKEKTEIVLGSDHCPIYDNSNQGVLRSKIENGEGTIPVLNGDEAFTIQTLDGLLRGERLKTMSCSDKILRWNFLGLQGSLLSQIMEPVYLSSIILGNLFNAGHLSRAVCCRVERLKILNTNINHPSLVGAYIGELSREVEKTNELSINWHYSEKVEVVDGVTGKLCSKLSTDKDISRLSKASLFHQYLILQQKLICKMQLNDLTYAEVKSLSEEYQKNKQTLYFKFHCAKLGSWIRKPLEQDCFRNQYAI